MATTVNKGQALISLDTTKQRLPVGNTKLYELLGSGAIESVRIGRRRLIVEQSLDSYIESLRERD